jgi:rubrerythrin
MSNNHAATVPTQIVDADVGPALARYSVSRPRRCRQCGTEVSRSTKRCPICGQPLSAQPLTG